MMEHLFPLLRRLAQLQGETVDALALQDALHNLKPAVDNQDIRAVINGLVHTMHLPAAQWPKTIDPSIAPALCFDPQWGLGILQGLNAQGAWVLQQIDSTSAELKWSEHQRHDLTGVTVVKLRLAKLYDAVNSPVLRIIKDEFLHHKKHLLEAAIGGLVINAIALATSLYSMQVYDRVVPTGAVQTLSVLTLGVIFAIAFEFAIKHLRAHIFDHLIDQVDKKLARTVFLRFLSIRMDQMPRSVGALASQLRGYESVRAFLAAVTMQMLVDAPFALIFIALIGFIGHPLLALIPAIFFSIALVIGLHHRDKIEALATKSTAAANFKIGLLVETVEGAETIKSGHGGWRMLSRWMHTTDDARTQELELRRLTEHSQHIVATFQQISYVLLVASGAMLIAKGEISMGSLIACSILSGRVLAPVAMIPGQLMQWANVKAALQGLDRLWKLECDHHEADHVITPETLRGAYRFEKVVSQYSSLPALKIDALTIQPGEKIGVLGPIGAGKTTFLRLLSGMYKPNQGRIFLDNIDLGYIHKTVLTQHIGYLQQDGRLFAGSLRDNLLLGMLDPGDEAIYRACEKTGLLATVVAPHPKGLAQEILEGGSGLSGGQRQLVNLTRVFLRQPHIWLLDEPTSSMDQLLERHVFQTLRAAIQPSDTLVLVTHKPEMLSLVDRLIVIAGNTIVMDGPKDQVIQKLQAKPQAHATEESVAA
jgi:ATP-binding cassette subfamily C protein LapB